ncbi:5378_t:CDS:1, partial [Paraglomus occultum]
MAPEIGHVEPIDDKPKSPKIIEKLVSDEAGSVNNEPEISPDLPAKDELKSSDEETPQQISCPPGYLTRKQREVRLRKKAIELGEDPHKFVTITEK